MLDPDTELGSGREHVGASEVMDFAKAFEAVAFFQHYDQSGVAKQQERIAAALAGSGKQVVFFEPTNQTYMVTLK